MDTHSKDRTVEVGRNGRIVTVTVARPRARNALSHQVLSELRDLLSTLADDDEIAGILLTGAPGPAFVAGADIREMAAMGPAEGARFGALGQQVTRLIEALPVPAIACVDGYALGGGCELALACDLVYATRKAVFGQPEVLLGLAQAVFDSREEMLAAARATLMTVARNSPVAVALAKAAMNDARGCTVDAGLAAELSAFRATFASPDMAAGTAAFLAKREPVFPGRVATG